MNSGKLKHRLLWRGGSLLVLILVFWGMVRLASNTQTPVNSGTLTVPVGVHDNIEGTPRAVVTLVEYSDFQCPACALFAPLLHQLLQEPELVGKLRIVYRYFPLSGIHANAVLSARVAQSAALQGKFWEMHDVLFANQSVWAGKSSADARTTFMGYAQQFGLNLQQFTSDLDSTTVANRVQGDYTSGVESGVSSTPSFFLNGTLMPHPASYAEFKQMIINALPQP